MLANSSSNDSHPPFPKMSYSHCLITRPSTIIYTTFIVINVVLFLPLFILVLYHGLQQWWKNCSSTMSHSDSFTYHLVIMELIGVCGCIISFGGIYGGEIKAVKMGSTLFSFTWYGEGFFHILTCAEQYLAVVHPINYRSLRNKRGIKIRNIILVCVWLLCSLGLSLAIKENYIIMDSCIIILTITIVPFCSISVLRVLTQSGPAEQGSERVNQSKQRAFYTIVAILGVIALRLSWNVIFIVNTLEVISTNCIVMTCEVLFNLPSSLVLPLLFLQRAGKLVCCKNI
ncbi:hypothetical protein ILYODFUR_007708 [Ilyodon furcidens]|uniref:G-protein coupled receptors family 1 profile domain-containing protein n=1 Tax=Ilyodon furcidens TaxID=33524 RepID=A0ABV0TWY5_9TELE